MPSRAALTRCLLAVITVCGAGYLSACGDDDDVEGLDVSELPADGADPRASSTPADAEMPNADEMYIDLVEVGADPATLRFPERAAPFAAPDIVKARRPLLSNFFGADVPVEGVVIVEFATSGAPPCDGIGGVAATVDGDVVIVELQPVTMTIPTGKSCDLKTRIGRVSIAVPEARPGMQVLSPTGEAPEFTGLRPGWERRAGAPTNLNDIPRPGEPTPRGE